MTTYCDIPGGNVFCYHTEIVHTHGQCLIIIASMQYFQFTDNRWHFGDSERSFVFTFVRLPSIFAIPMHTQHTHAN